MPPASDVQPLNYCSHAIEDLQRAAASVLPRFAPTGQVLRRVAGLLDKAVKFLLPDRGELIDLQRIDEATMELLRLPFPLLALEVPFSSAGGLVTEGVMKETPSTRRIVLAWDESMVASIGLSPDYKEPGVYVVAVYYQDETREWVTAPLGLFLPRDNEVRHVSDGVRNAADALAVQTLLSQDAITGKSAVLDAHYFQVLPQLAELMARELGPEVALARMQLDVRDEMLCIWSFCMTVNCVNISMDRLAPAEKLNAKRIKNGKPPLYEYRVLTLPEPRVHGAQTSRLEGGRAGPRTHLRRGHPRRLADGRTTYVRAAVIGQGNLGVVHKDYRVTA